MGTVVSSFRTRVEDRTYHTVYMQVSSLQNTYRVPGTIRGDLVDTDYE